jgi:PIN domain nuclease of toxin-antitoxin system
MIAAVADTHTAIWYLVGDPRLSPVARELIDRSAAKRLKVAVSAITLAEVVYLTEKRRIREGVFEALLEAVRRPHGVLQGVPVDEAVVERMQQVGRLDVPDLPDRIIAATALRFEVPIISRDRKIRAAGLQTVW